MSAATLTASARPRKARIDLPLPPATIDDALRPATPRAEALAALAELRQCRRDARARYAGGLPAERQAADALRRADRERRRGTVAGTRGRRIELIALLRQRDATGQPVWALVDPLAPINHHNGRVDTDGNHHLPSWHTPLRQWRCATQIQTSRTLGRGSEPDGLPALPPEARAIVTDRRVRERARFVAVLYQPQSWRQANPDPAVVVEWLDRPGEYFALAVWGDDRAVIEEFVH